MAIHRISREKRALAIMALSEGTAVNSVSRIAGISKPTLLAWFVECGKACEAWHDKHFVNLTGVTRLEVDEQWSYVGIHQQRMTEKQQAQHPEKGDSWFWAALDPVSRAIVSWRTGKRNFAECLTFARDTAKRVPGEVQITSDGLTEYPRCVRLAFGPRAHYAQEIKEFQREWQPDPDHLKKRVDPLKAVHRKAIQGKPNMNLATVCHIERYFLTVRQGNKRTARKTLAYSKKWTNHAATSSLHCFIYNMMKKHTSLEWKTPAQVLGVSDKRWTAEMVVDMVDAWRKEQEDNQFAEAFNTPSYGAPVDAKTIPPRERRFYPGGHTERPKTLKWWYKVPDSGGARPPLHLRKPGIRYADTPPGPGDWMLKPTPPPRITPEIPQDFDEVL